MDGTIMNSTFIIPLTQMDVLQSTTGTANLNLSGDEEENTSFLDLLTEKIQGVKNLETASLESAYAVSTGQSDDLESAMIDSAKASAAIELTTQLTTRAVNAYKEILSMQV